MRAARFHGRADIRIEDVDVPSLAMSDEVLVEVLFCGICGTDLHEYSVGPIVTPVTPHPLTGVTIPQTLGHEFSARVVEIGSEVTDVAVGDRVAIMPAIVCGKCYFCRRGLGHLCVKFACTGLSAETGGLAQYAVLKDYQVSALPDSMSDAEGAVVEPACVAAYGIDRAGVRGGDVVLVTGARPDRHPVRDVRLSSRGRDRRHRGAEPESCAARRGDGHRSGARSRPSTGSPRRSPSSLAASASTSRPSAQGQRPV